MRDMNMGLLPIEKTLNRSLSFSNAGSANSPKVTIVILNYNGWRDSIECLDSLSKVEYPDFSVLFVDNASTDSSVETVWRYCEERGWPAAGLTTLSRELPHLEEDVTKSCGLSGFRISGPDTAWKSLLIVTADKNYGYAEGNNIGMKMALSIFSPDYILILNNDVIVETTFLRELVTAAESDSRIAISGPQLLRYHKPSRSFGVHKNKINVWTADFHFPFPEEFSASNGNSYDVGCVSGCCLLIRSQMLKEVGGLDPDYFMYWEEVDWCLRFHRAGFKIVLVPTARVWHKVGSTIGLVLGHFYFGRNTFVFMKKNANRVQIRFFIVFFLLFRFWFHCAIILLFHRSRAELLAYVSGVRKGFELLTE